MAERSYDAPTRTTVGIRGRGPPHFL